MIDSGMHPVQISPSVCVRPHCDKSFVQVDNSILSSRDRFYFVCMQLVPESIINSIFYLKVLFIKACMYVFTYLLFDDR